jgi:hypothetical protein
MMAMGGSSEGELTDDSTEEEYLDAMGNNITKSEWTLQVPPLFIPPQHTVPQRTPKPAAPVEQAMEARRRVVVKSPLEMRDDSKGIEQLLRKQANGEVQLAAF